MARLNVKTNRPTTHGGGFAAIITPEQQLRRLVLPCLLWEDNYYVDGKTIAENIALVTAAVPGDVASRVAIEARKRFHLRHVPLLIVREMARYHAGTSIVSDTLAEIIDRADEAGEFLTLYFKDEGKSKRNHGKGQPLSAQVKKGIARSMVKWDRYQLAKYAKGGGIRLRDTMFLTHPKPNEKMAPVWKELADDELSAADAGTWEAKVSASGGNTAAAAATFAEMLKDGSLGYLALIRNLRQMLDKGVDINLIKDALVARKGAHKVFPFRFVAAARAAPEVEDAINEAFVGRLSQMPKLGGKTIIIIDVSGSMYGGKVSKNSDMDRALAGCALAAILRGVCENPRIYATAGNDLMRIHKTALVQPLQGIPLVGEIYKQTDPLGGGGIFLKQVMDYVKAKEGTADRTIVFTDEQDCSHGEADSPLYADTFGRMNYLINVASHANGIGYGKWVHIDGFSEAVMDFIWEYERVPLD